MIAVVAAFAEGGVMGKDGKMPWHLPGDLARFRRLTLGQTVVMGRKTYESIGHLLPGRRVLVLSRSLAPAPTDTQLVRSLEEAHEIAQQQVERGYAPFSTSDNSFTSSAASAFYPFSTTPPSPTSALPIADASTHSPSSAFSLLFTPTPSFRFPKTLFVAGGQEVYALALPKADILYLTQIHAPFSGDRFFPAWPQGDFCRVYEQHNGGSPPYTFYTYLRKKLWLGRDEGNRD